MFIDDEEVIKSVQRVFEIFEWFDKARQPASATIIARALGYPVSSTNSLVKSMSELGYLTFDPISRDYFPTLRITQKAAWMDTGWYGPGRLRSLIRELSESTGEAVTVSCQNDLQMLFVEVNEPANLAETVVASVGKPAPLFRSAVGFSALSCRSDREVNGLLNRYNRRTYRPGAKADPTHVLERVRRVRATGHAIGYDLYVQNTGAIAWALPHNGSGHPAVIAVGGPSERLRTNECAILNAGHKAISRFLAF